MESRIPYGEVETFILGDHQYQHQILNRDFRDSDPDLSFVTKCRENTCTCVRKRLAPPNKYLSSRNESATKSHIQKNSMYEDGNLFQQAAACLK